MNSDRIVDFGRLLILLTCLSAFAPFRSKIREKETLTAEKHQKIFWCAY